MQVICPLPSVQCDIATHLWEKSSLKTSFNLPMTSFSQSGTKLPYFFITSSRNPLNIPERWKCKHIKTFWVHQSNKALSSYKYKQQSFCTQPTCSTTHGKYIFKKTKLKLATLNKSGGRGRRTKIKMHESDHSALQEKISPCSCHIHTYLQQTNYTSAREESIPFPTSISILNHFTATWKAISSRNRFHWEASILSLWQAEWLSSNAGSWSWQCLQPAQFRCRTTVNRKDARQIPSKFNSFTLYPRDGI